MQLKLRILRGQLQHQPSGDASGDIAVRRLPFLIGSGADCHLCCRSDSVSLHHCEIRSTGEALAVCDLASAAGTFINDVLVSPEAPLRDHDRLKVGRLEFEILLDLPVVTPSAISSEVLHHVSESADPVDLEVSEMLAKADEAERLQRMLDPSSRVFRVDTTPAAATPPAEDSKETVRRPQKKPPGKLPPPPGIQGKDTIDAAQEALKKLFEKKHK